MKLIKKAIEFVKEVVDTAVKVVKDFFKRVINHAEATVILVVASIGFRVLLENSVNVKFLPALASSIVVLLMSISQWRINNQWILKASIKS